MTLAVPCPYRGDDDTECTATCDVEVTTIGANIPERRSADGWADAERMELELLFPDECDDGHVFTAADVDDIRRSALKMLALEVLE